VEDVCHLSGRLTVRAGVGHGEVRGDAFRREEEIAGIRAEPAVEIDGEGIAAPDSLGLSEEGGAAARADWLTNSERRRESSSFMHVS